MSWQPYFHIAAKRPWPDAVRMVRPNTKEIRRYVPERTCQGHTDQEYFDCHLVTFNCMACGWEGVVDSGFVDYSSKESDMPNFCPSCGAKVIDE